MAEGELAYYWLGLKPHSTPHGAVIVHKYYQKHNMYNSAELAQYQILIIYLEQFQ